MSIEEQSGHGGDEIAGIYRSLIDRRWGQNDGSTLDNSSIEALRDKEEPQWLVSRVLLGVLQLELRIEQRKASWLGALINDCVGIDVQQMN